MPSPKKVEKKPTEYVVLRSEENSDGPFSIVGSFTAHGQIAAKKTAAAALAHEGSDPESSWFIAVPATSFYPQKPVVQMTITFLADDGNEAEEPEEDGPEADDGTEDDVPEPEDDPDPVVEDNDPESDPEDDDLGGLR